MSDPGGAVGLDGFPPAPDPDSPVAFVLDGAIRPSGSLSLTSILDQPTRELERTLGGRILVVDARLCGLDEGLLNELSERPVSTIDDGWSGEADEAPWKSWPSVRLREMADADRRSRNAFPVRDGWRETHAMPYRISPQSEIESWVVVEKRPGGGEGEEARAIAPEPQLLADHHARAGIEAARIARALGLEEADQAMLVAAARCHDEGKRAARWQRAFGADRRDGPLGKTPGPVNRRILNGYRHELKSVLDARNAGLVGIPKHAPHFDLALHLIAAHHGHARPTITVDGYDDFPPSVAEALAHEVATRFARLQRQWGPWGLAWWEALLRSADQCASRKHEAEVGEQRSQSELVRRSPDVLVASGSRGIR